MVGVRYGTPKATGGRERAHVSAAKTTAVPPRQAKNTADRQKQPRRHKTTTTIQAVRYTRTATYAPFVANAYLSIVACTTDCGIENDAHTPRSPPGPTPTVPTSVTPLLPSHGTMALPPDEPGWIAVVDLPSFRAVGAGAGAGEEQEGLHRARESVRGCDRFNRKSACMYVCQKDYPCARWCACAHVCSVFSLTDNTPHLRTLDTAGRTAANRRQRFYSGTTSHHTTRHPYHTIKYRLISYRITAVQPS